MNFPGSSSEMIPAAGSIRTMVNDRYLTTVYVGGLKPGLSLNRLREMFSIFGTIISVDIPFGRDFGFVRFLYPESAMTAFGMDGHLDLETSSLLAVRPYICNGSNRPRFQPVILTPSFQYTPAPPPIRFVPNEPHPPGVPPPVPAPVEMGPRLQKTERDKKIDKIMDEVGSEKKSIVVTGLATSNVDLLNSHFSECGKVVSVVVMYKPMEGEESRGIAKITYEQKYDAAMAIYEKHCEYWIDSKLCCNWWTRSKKRWIRNLIHDYEQGKENQRDGRLLKRHASPQNEVIGKAEKRSRHASSVCPSHPSRSSIRPNEKEMDGNHRIGNSRRRLYLPLTGRWLSPPPQHNLPTSEDKAKAPSEVQKLAKHFKENFDLRAGDRAKMMLELLKSLKPVDVDTLLANCHHEEELNIIILD